MSRQNKVLAVLMTLATFNLPAYSQAETSNNPKQEKTEHGRRYGGFDNHRSLEIIDEKPLIKEPSNSSRKVALSGNRKKKGQHHKSRLRHSIKSAGKSRAEHTQHSAATK